MDWNDFASKVPAGSQARFLYLSLSKEWRQGMILENKPFGLIDKSDHFFSQNGLRFARFEGTPQSDMRIDADKMQYLIDGEWLTIIQVMMRIA
jgi:hypothetical protein